MTNINHSKMQHCIYTEISGKLFNKLNGETKIFKILNEDLYHNGFKYEIGLNIDFIDFNPTNESEAGGLYFCEERFICYYINLGIKIAIVGIPDDARVYVESKKFKADKIILSNIILLKDFDKFADPVFCTLAVQQNGLALQYVLKQTEELCKLAVQRNGLALKFVKEQTEEICKLAVQQYGMAIKFVKEQTEEICKLAVQQNGYALQFVKEQTEEICKLAIQQNVCALQFVKEQTDEICKLAVQQNGRALQLVKEQTEEICKLAVQQNGEALEFVEEPMGMHYNYVD